jgi:hypothetical protein
VLLLFEDVHWADADLARSARSDGRARPRPAGIGDDHLPAGIRGALDRALARHRHRARPLPPAEVEILAEHVAGRPLPPEVTAQIVAKTDGVPLFVEELTKAVLEGGLLVAGPQGWRLDGPLPRFAIPATERWVYQRLG